MTNIDDWWLVSLPPMLYTDIIVPFKYNVIAGTDGSYAIAACIQVLTGTL